MGVAIVAALGLLAVGVVSGVVVWRRRRRQVW